MNKNRQRIISLAGTSFGVLLLAVSSPARGQSTCGLINTTACVVPEGATLFAVESSGTGSTIENRGTVTTSIGTTGDGSGVDNAGIVGGSIATTGNSSDITNGETVGFALETTGDSSPVNNFGSVGTFIVTQGGNSGITNSGAVGTRIRTNGDNSEVNNSGTVAANVVTTGIRSDVNNSGTVGDNIRTEGIDSNVNNVGSVAGNIIAEGDDSNVSSAGTVGGSINNNSLNPANVKITNSGSVGTSIEATGELGRVENSGSVGSFIRTTGANAQVENSGAVGRGTAGDGIFIDGENPYLTLLPGSVIQGSIDFNGGGSRTLDVVNGLSINNTFGVAPNRVIANGAPFAALGDRVAVVDTTNLATQDEQLADLTGNIYSVVEGRLTALRERSGAAEVARASSRIYPTDLDRSIWIETFAAFRNQEAKGPSVETDQRLFGLMLGVDPWQRQDLRAGVFAGGALGQVETDTNSQKTDSRSFFLGTYASLIRSGLIFDMTFTAGYSEFDQHRQVANNTVVGGLETASSDFDGWFVSPTLTITKPTEFRGQRLEGSLALRYAGLFLDEYSESGTSAPLTVDSRDVHIGVIRLQLAAPNETVTAGGSLVRTRVQAGLEARSNFGGDTLDGALLGQNVTFKPSDDGNVLGGYLSLSGEIKTKSGLILNATTEGLIDSDGSFQYVAQAGIEFKF